MITLSGGDLGGTQVDGSSWAVGAEQVIQGYRYRNVDGQIAVFVAKE